MSSKYPTDSHGMSGWKQTSEWRLDARGGRPCGRIAYPEGDLDASARQVVNSHGCPRREHGGAEEETRDESPDADSRCLQGHRGERRRPVEERRLRAVGFHDRVDVPQGVEAQPLCKRPPVVEARKRKVLVLVHTEAKLHHAASRSAQAYATPGHPVSRRQGIERSHGGDVEPTPRSFPFSPRGGEGNTVRIRTPQVRRCG